MPIFKVERDGKTFNMESPDLQTAMQDLEAYERQSGGLQQAASPQGTGTEPEPASEGRWGPNPLKMAVNLPGSMYELGKGMVNTVANPIEAAQNAYNMGWDGFKQMIYDQYGTYDNFINYMENNPAQFMTDMTMLSGPIGMATKASGIAGKVGMVGKIGSAVEKTAAIANKADPFAMAAAAATKGATGTGRLASTVLGGTTGTGESVATAAEAGYKGALSSKPAGAVLDKVGLGAAKGGDEGQAFRSHQKGVGDPEAVVTKAQDVVKSKKFLASVEHHKDLQPILQDPTKLDIQPVNDAIDKVLDRKTTSTGVKMRNEPAPAVKKAIETVMYYQKGGVDIKGKTMPTPPKRLANGKLGKPGTRPMDWNDLPDNPDAYTMENFHQMRREIGAIMRELPYNDPVRAEVGKVYYAVRDGIDQAYAKSSPNAAKGYGKVLSDYHKAMDEADELIKTFSLGDGAAKDTAIRKMQSIMRVDTAHSNFGVRSKLADALIEAGHKNLAYEIAGMHTRPMLKGSFLTIGAGGAGLGAVAAGGVSPQLLGLMVAFSPKLIGRAAYESGRVAGSIIKPAVAIDKALKNKLGKAYTPVKKGAQYGTAQAGRLAEAGENREQLKADILSEAKKRGYQVHDRVLNTVMDKIMGDDPDAYLSGVRAVGRNPRLLKLFEEMGTKGER
jgi:hypothetical protein